MPPTASDINDITQLTELEYLQAVVKKQENLLLAQGREILNLSNKTQLANVAIQNKPQVLIRAEDRADEAHADLRELKLRLDMYAGLLKELWQECILEMKRHEWSSFSRQLVHNRAFRQFTAIIMRNEGVSEDCQKTIEVVCKNFGLSVTKIHHPLSADDQVETDSARVVSLSDGKHRNAEAPATTVRCKDNSTRQPIRVFEDNQDHPTLGCKRPCSEPSIPKGSKRREVDETGLSFEAVASRSTFENTASSSSP